MLDCQMETLANDVVKNQMPQCFTLSHKEVADGDVVLVTTHLTKAEEGAEWCLPGMAHVTDDGKMTVTPFATNIWSEGWATVKSVAVDEKTKLRRWRMPGMALPQHSTFAQMMGKAKEGIIETAATEVQKNHKKIGANAKEFYMKTVSQLSEELTLEWWTTATSSNSPGKDASCAKLSERIEETYNALLSEVTSSMSGAEAIAEFKSSLQRIDAVKRRVKEVLTTVSEKMDHSALAMRAPDILPLAPAPPPVEPDANGASGDAVESLVRKIINPELKAIRDTLAILSASLNIKAAVTPEPAKEKEEAFTVKIPTDHACGYHAMALVEQYAGKPQEFMKYVFKPEQAEEAKFRVMYQAKKLYDEDKELFKTTHQDETIDSYIGRMVEKPSTVNWAGHVEFLHFSQHAKNVEFRVISVDSKGNPCCVSTLKAGEKRQLVVFPVLTKSHFELGGIMKDGKPKVFFEAHEADEAQHVIMESVSLEGSSTKMALESLSMTPATDEDAFRRTVKDLQTRKDTSKDWKEVVKRNKPKAKVGAGQTSTPQNVRTKPTTWSGIVQPNPQQWAPQPPHTVNNFYGPHPDGAPPPSAAPWPSQTHTAADPGVPTLVVFAKGSAKNAWDALREASVDKKVQSVVKAGEGTPAERFIVYAKPDAVSEVQATIALFRKRGLRAEAYQARTGPGNSKLMASRAGVQTAATNVNVCRFYATRAPCPYAGRCRFSCYQAGGCY